MSMIEWNAKSILNTHFNRDYKWFSSSLGNKVTK